MTARLAIPDSVATVCLTSCGRPDLLWRTLDSFLSHHDPQRMILTEDSEDEAFAEAIRQRHPAIEVIANRPRKGQFASIDAMYAMVHSPHVLHLEDDWAVDGPCALAAATALIARRPDIAMVSIRSIEEFNRKYRRRSAREIAESVEMLVVPRDAHPARFGYSFNPGIVPLSIWRRFGPFLPHHTEMRFSKHLKELGFTMAYTVPGVARHIGDDRHVGDPFTIAAVTNPLKHWYIKARRLIDPMYGH